MAASYWESSQMRHWTYTKEQLIEQRADLENEDQKLVQAYPLPQLRFLNIFFNTQMLRLAKRLQVRQQAIATAQLYVRRFYLKVEIRSSNPYLVIATALYLACKVEEAPQHIRHIVTESRAIWPDVFTFEVPKLGECEFYLISEMNSQMIVHHAYRSLESLKGNFSMTADETVLAWSIINDSYMTDLPLLVAPHIIALTAMLLALLLRPTNAGNPSVAGGPALTAQQLSSIGPSAQAAFNGMAQSRTGTPTDRTSANVSARTKVQRLSTWLAESSIDIEAMIDSTQEIISLYELYEQYNEKLTREQINRFVKARGLDK